MVEAQQIVVMMPMFCIQIPSMPSIVLQKFIEIANFDIIPVDKIWESIFYMPSSYPLEARYQAVGIETTQFVANMGSLFIICMVVGIIMFFTALLSCCPCIKPARKINQYFQLKAFWVLPLQVFLESCMIVSLCSLLTLKNPNTESLGQKVDTWVSYIMGLLCIGFFIGVIFIMSYLKLDDENSIHIARTKYSSLYEDLDLKNRWIVFFRFAFMLRRIIIAIAIVLFEKLIYQLILGYFQSTMMLITVGNIVPFESKEKWIKELSNEMMILSSLYFVMCFSPFVPDAKAQDIVGYGFCAVIGAHCLINILMMLGGSIRNTIERLKRYLFIRRHMQLMNAKRDWLQIQLNRRVARRFFKRRELTVTDEDIFNYEQLNQFIEVADIYEREESNPPQQIDNLPIKNELSERSQSFKQATGEFRVAGHLGRDAQDSQCGRRAPHTHEDLDDHEESKTPQFPPGFEMGKSTREEHVQSLWDGRQVTEQQTDDSWDREDSPASNFVGAFGHSRNDSSTPLNNQLSVIHEAGADERTFDKQTKDFSNVFNLEVVEDVEFTLPTFQENPQNQTQMQTNDSRTIENQTQQKQLSEIICLGISELDSIDDHTILDFIPLHKRPQKQKQEPQKNQEWGLQTKSAIQFSKRMRQLRK